MTYTDYDSWRERVLSVFSDDLDMIADLDAVDQLRADALVMLHTYESDNLPPAGVLARLRALRG